MLRWSENYRISFGFDYSIEIYVPESQRKYGYYILPVLHGDTFIARIDRFFKKDSKQSIINRVYAESENSAKLGNEVSRAVSDLRRIPRSCEY